MNWRLFTIGACLSLALLLAIVVMWAGSYSVPLRPVRRIPGTGTWIRLTHQHGTLTAAWLPDRSPVPPPTSMDFPDRGPGVLGFSYRRAVMGGAASVVRALTRMGSAPHSGQRPGVALRSIRIEDTTLPTLVVMPCGRSRPNDPARSQAPLGSRPVKMITRRTFSHGLRITGRSR